MARSAAPGEDVAADECYGLQPDLTLRMAVIDAGDTTLLAWLRHAGIEEIGDAPTEFAAFEDMLASISFRDESPMTTKAPADVATALDGVSTTSVTEDELASSPLLNEPDEVNDQTWGHLTFTFDKGHFTYTQENAKDSYESAGTFTIDGDTVDLNLDNTEHFVMRWHIEGDTLTFERDDALGIAPTLLVLRRGRGRTDGDELAGSASSSRVASTVLVERGTSTVEPPSVEPRLQWPGPIKQPQQPSEAAEATSGREIAPERIRAR